LLLNVSKWIKLKAGRISIRRPCRWLSTRGP